MISLKRLQEHFGEEKGQKIRDLLTQKVKTRSYQSVSEWEKECYHRPKYEERLMVALDEVLEGYGVEYIEAEGKPLYSYVNLGDTYTTTLLMDNETGRVFIDSWGNLVERKRL